MKNKTEVRELHFTLMETPTGYDVVYHMAESTGLHDRRFGEKQVFIEKAPALEAIKVLREALIKIRDDGLIKSYDKNWKVEWHQSPASEQAEQALAATEHWSEE